MIMLFLLLLLSTLSVSAQEPAKPKVILVGEGKVREVIQQSLSELLFSVTQYSREKKPMTFPPAYTATPDREFGLKQLKQLADTTNISFDERVLESDLIDLSDGSWEVRKIYVSIRDSIARREKEMVATFDKDGFLVGARFALEEHQYDKIINSARDVEDSYRLKMLLSYLERFRTAYNKKDIEFIEQQFSEKALIITGTRIEESSQAPGIKQSGETEAKFKLTRQSKKEYIANLRNKVFKRAAFINVEFEEIKVYHHEVYDAVYGVNLKQKWSTSGYSDIGYLFLMIDYSDEAKPVIHVRAWQPNSMIVAGEKPIELGMFELIK